MTNGHRYQQYIRDSCFVFCATDSRDSLNQWQHYSDRQGYAIGLLPGGTFQTLVGQMPDPSMYLLSWADVVYHVDEQRKLAHDFLDFTVSFFNTDKEREAAVRGGFGPLDSPTTYFTHFMAYFISACKQEGFAAEREVRFVATSTGSA